MYLGVTLLTSSPFCNTMQSLTKEVPMLNIDNLKKAREATHLTQSQVAKELSISDGSYKNYEQGKREPNNTLLCKIAELFNVTTDYLLGFDKSSQPDPTLHYSDNKRIMSAIDTLSNSDISDDDLNVIEAVLRKYKR